MKTRIKNLFLLPALIAGLALIMAGRVTAQTFTNLHSFIAVSDGATPFGGLILSGNTLYGTARAGGSSGNGTVFKVNTDGSGFTNLHSFTHGSDGYDPIYGLILSGNTLYGTTLGGSAGGGTLFAVNTDGTGFTNLHSFTVSEGLGPNGVILSGNTLYGTATDGGSANKGTLFAVNTDGSGFTNFHNFNSGSDGARPQSRLILSGNTLYGTAAEGGSSGGGTVFAVNTNGTGFTNLHSFTGSDGVVPKAGLILSGNILYGTASAGGPGLGTIFAINTNGTGFTNLHSFTGSDGANPYAGLILSGNTLYGAAYNGGSSGGGTIFAVNTNGTGFTNLHSFTSSSEGANPFGSLILSGNSLYGAASSGGSAGIGTVFSLSLGLVSTPQLTNLFVSPANSIIGVTSNQQFTVTGYYNNGSSQTLTNGSAGTNLLWSSSSTNVASITTNGVATGLTNGVTTITVTSGSISNNTTLTVVSPPAITVQPTNNTVSPNASVTLNVAATGGGLSYQWQFNGTNITGATGASLTITNVTSATIGVYTVIVSNAAGSVTSSSVLVASVDIHMLASVYVSGPIGSNYLIQATSNMPGGWTTLTNIALPSQPYIYVDYSSATNKQQFYRVVPQ